MSTLLQTEVKGALPLGFATGYTGLLHRKCAYGRHTLVGGECVEHRKECLNLHHRATNMSKPAAVPSIVHEVLRSPDQPLDLYTCGFKESQLKHDLK